VFAQEEAAIGTQGRERCAVQACSASDLLHTMKMMTSVTFNEALGLTYHHEISGVPSNDEDDGGCA
jgi:hypothetical protein